MAETTNSFVFKEMIKNKLRGMSARRRKRFKPRTVNQWLYPAGQERKYTRYLFDLMNEYSRVAVPRVRANIERWVDEQNKIDYKKDDFNTEFQQLINELNQMSYDMFNPRGAGVDIFNNDSIRNTLLGLGFGVSAFNEKQWNKFTNKIIDTPFVASEPWLQSTIDTWANNNFTLIKSLTDEYIKKLNTIVSDGVETGRTWDGIMGDVRKMDRNMTKTRARLITRDQIGKLNGTLSKRRQQEAGLDLYIWRTARDERVRATHRPLNNKICRWDDSSVYADSIEQALEGNWQNRFTARMYVGIPGQDIQCRCVAIPVFDEIIEESNEEILREAA